MGQPESQIKLDYRPEDKPAAARTRPQLHWLASAIATPLVGGFLLLMGSGHTPATSNASLLSTGLETHALALPPLSESEVVAPAPEPAGSSLDLEVRRGDTLDQLFRKNRLDVGELHEMLALPEARDGLRYVKPGDVLELRTDDDGIAELSRRLDESHTLVIERGGDGFRAHTIEDPLEHRTTQAHAVIDSSRSTQARAPACRTRSSWSSRRSSSGTSTSLDIRDGDSFSVLYDQVHRDGEYLRDCEIVAPSSRTTGDTFRALRYTTRDGQVNYYTPDGLSMRGLCGRQSPSRG